MKKTMTIAGCVLLTLVIAAGFVLGGSALGSANDIQPAGDAQVGNVQSLSLAQQQTVTGKIVNLAATSASSDVQLIEAKVEVFAYPEITVEAGRPVRINFKVDAANLNACNNEILIPEWNIDMKLSAGDNFVDFTPTKAGTFKYSCWMDMIQSNIIVTAAAQPSAQSAEPSASPSNQPKISVPDDTLVIPEASSVSEASVSVDGDVTVIEAKIAPGGYPQIVVEAGKPVRINFKADDADLNSCNDEIVIPEWNIRKTLSAGDNFVEFTPAKTGTFNYSCWMGMINSSITVIEQGSGDIGALPMDESANTPKGCGMMSGSGGWGSMMNGNGSRTSGGGCCGGR